MVSAPGEKWIICRDAPVSGFIAFTTRDGSSESARQAEPDEAHLLLPKEGKAGLLGSLARQGRSWGFPVWLASQDADAFITTGNNATNFAELAECGAHFSPHTLTDAQQRMILGGVIHWEVQEGGGGAAAARQVGDGRIAAVLAGGRKAAAGVSRCIAWDRRRACLHLN